MNAPPSHPGLPFVGNTLSIMRDQLGFHEDAVDRSGDLFRANILGVGEYCIAAHPDYFERILISDRDAFAKTDDYQIAFGEGVLTTEGERWKNQRDDLEEFFYPGKIRSYADEMVERTSQRLDRWADGQRMHLYKELKQLALDVIFATVFDRPLAIDGDERLRTAADRLNLFFKSTSYALPRWVPTPARRQFQAAVDTLESEAKTLLAEQKRSETAGNGLLSTLVTLRETGATTMSDDEIVDQVVTLTFAGHDTTALVMTAALHQLGNHPSVRERFHAELSDVLGGDAPTADDVEELTVTRNIVNETLRMYPSVFLIPRKTTRRVELGGYELDSGTRIHLSFWSVHRDDRFWTDPDVWRPARWQETSPREKGHAFVPFGAGRRACIGRRFARLEATLVLATIAQQFLIDPAGPLQLEPEATLSVADDAPVRVHTRG